MLKMILADDDELVLEMLQTVIDWSALNIQITALAKNGEEALELCREHSPDILFTDIKMPVISGLEVAMTLQDWGSATKIIIVSGAQDFDFARTALDMKVEGYVLKPIRIEEVTRIIQKTVKNILLEQNQDQVRAAMCRQIEEHKNELCEIFLRNLVEGYFTTSAEVCDKIEYFNLDLQLDTPITIAILTIDSYAQMVKKKGENDKQFLNFAITKVVQEILKLNDMGYAVMLTENRFAMLLKAEQSNNILHEDLLREIIDKLQDFLSVSASIGLGNIANGLLELRYSYDNAYQVVAQKFYRGTGVILYSDDVLYNGEFERLEFTSGFSQLFALRRKLLEELKTGDSEQCNVCLTDLFALLSQKNTFEIEYVRSMCIELAATICHIFYELAKRESAKEIDPRDIINRILLADTVHDIGPIISKLCDLYLLTHEKQLQNKHSTLVKQVLAIIHEHYMHNLTIKAIADEIYVTPNYISLIFKREMGTTLNAYLTQIRLEKACQLLKQEHLKIWEIAHMVGYENTHYFSTLFKKVFGVQPQQYRTNREP